MKDQTIISQLQAIQAQPEMFSAVNNAVVLYHRLDPDRLEEYSVWKAQGELRIPEMKREMGFIITFLKSITKLQQSNNKGSEPC